MQKYDDENIGHYRLTIDFDASNNDATNGGNIHGHNTAAAAPPPPPPHLDRYTVLLKDGETTATIYPIHSIGDLPEGLMAFLCDEINMEIERGETYQFFDPLDLEAFQNFWFSHFAGVMILGDSPTLDGPKQWEKECLGTFYIKPNFLGRCGHICTASFLVNAGIRGKGIGRTLADCFLQWAPRMGYTSALFGLVFETNVAIRRIFETLNFKRIGRMKAAAILKGHDSPVDSIMYGKELVNDNDPAVGAYRFDKIKFYLETGRYPAMADRQEKSRLRSSSSHYKLENGKLMLKGKEVISDPVRQIQICLEIHLINHGGINKTTSMVAEKYHWSKIKDTVAVAIRGCTECREQARDPHVVKRSSPTKKVPSGANRRINKVLHSQPNNPNARQIIKSRLNNQSVEDIVSAQLGRGDESILSTHDLSTLDDNIIAAVEAAQRSQFRGHTSYAAAAASADSNDYNQYQQEYPQYPDNRTKVRSNSGVSSHNIPVDPEVEGFDHDGREEIEIARALIQANEDVGTSTNRGTEGARTNESHDNLDRREENEKKRNTDETNMFFKE